MSDLYVVWDFDPVIFTVFGRPVVWYGLLWAVSFVVGYYIIRKMFRREMPDKQDAADALTDRLLIYMIVGSIVGARLGHCLFYEPSYYFAHPWKFLAVWEGGLASHGGAIGILLALYLFSRKEKMPYVGVVDRIVVVVALAGALIRLGNLTNSEIYGFETTMPWGFKFVRDCPPEWSVEMVPACHPTQIYEALFCIATFIYLMYAYFKKNLVFKKPGMMLGVFLIVIFGSRIMIEFLKRPQVDFENNMILDMGQWLSIPFVIAGFWLCFRKQKNVAE